MKEKNSKNKEKGITLIALIITVIIMLILVAVTIDIAVDGKLFDKAQDAVDKTNDQVGKEQNRVDELMGQFDQLIGDLEGEENKVVIEAPTEYFKTFQVGDNITAYLVENEEATETNGKDTYDMLFVGTGEMWEAEEWNGEILESVNAGYGSYNYYWIYEVQNVQISYGITNIPESTFAYGNCVSISIPSSVTSIGMRAFDYCSNLAGVTIPSSVTSIEEMAFRGCANLTSAILPNNITIINMYLFYGCSSLESIVIPKGVTSIGTGAFDCCRARARVDSR